MEGNERVVIDFDKSVPDMLEVLLVKFNGGGVNACISDVIGVNLGIHVCTRPCCRAGRRGQCGDAQPFVQLFLIVARVGRRLAVRRKPFYVEHDNVLVILLSCLLATGERLARVSAALWQNNDSWPCLSGCD